MINVWYKEGIWLEQKIDDKYEIRLNSLGEARKWSLESQQNNLVLKWWKLEVFDWRLT